MTTSNQPPPTDADREAAEGILGEMILGNENRAIQIAANHAAQATATANARIAELEADNARLRGSLKDLRSMIGHMAKAGSVFVAPIDSKEPGPIGAYYVPQEFLTRIDTLLEQKP